MCRKCEGLRRGKNKNRLKCGMEEVKEKTSHKGVIMANTVTYAIPAQSLKALVFGEGRVRKVYENGSRTDRDVVLNGKPVLRYQAAFSTDGVTCLGQGSLDTTSEIVSGFGQIFQGLPGQQAQVTVAPGSQFEVRLTVQVEGMVPTKAEEK